MSFFLVKMNEVKPHFCVMYAHDYNKSGTKETNLLSNVQIIICRTITSLFRKYA